MIENLLKEMTIREKVGQLNQRLYGWQVYEKVNGRIELTDYFKKEVAYFGVDWVDLWCFSGRPLDEQRFEYRPYARRSI